MKIEMLRKSCTVYARRNVYTTYMRYISLVCVLNGGGGGMVV
jgi:hypothetical protein